MRTINKSLLELLELQAAEADYQGLESIGSTLTSQIVKNAENIREDDEFYVYSSEEYENDVREQLWNITIRTADFFNQNFDAKNLAPLIEKYAQLLQEDLRAKFGREDGVGAYEPNVPGQDRSKVIFEVE